MKDVVVVGASAAGVSASIYLVRQKADFVLVSSDFGGEVATSGEVQNYPGIPNTNGIELAGKFKEHLDFYKVKPETDVLVEGIEKINGGFRVKAKKLNQSVSYEALAVIIATGSKPLELNIPGEKEFYHKGLSYCTVCDGPIFGGKRVAVIGGGNSANESGIMLSGIASQVYVITKNPDMKGDKELIDHLKSLKNVRIISNALTSEVFGDKLVKGLKYKDKEGKEQILEVEGIFVHIGMKPNSEFVDNFLKKNEYNEIVTDKDRQTSIPGIFAAGDVTDVSYKQIVIAAGQGVIAALSALRYVNKLKGNNNA